MRDPYEVLGLRPGASAEEIRAAYKKLAQEYSQRHDADAGAKMEELNTAFDALMANLRTGTAAGETDFAEIRRLINEGNADEALRRLTANPQAETSGEWNFLCGSAYYYKGWMDQALPYFEKATQLNPQNREYSAAYQRLKNYAAGNFSTGPYGQMPQNAYGCSCCDMCTALMCMDLCCGFGRGGCC